MTSYSKVTVSRLFASQMAIICLFLPASHLVAKEKIESRQAIYKAASQYIENQFDESYKLDIQIGYLDKRLRLASCQQPLDAFFPAQRHHLGATSVGIRCSEPGWKVYVPVQIRAYTSIITTKHPLPRGTILSQSDLQIEKREISRYRAGIFKKLEQVVGMMAKRAMVQGTVLTPTLVEPKRLVKRGQFVTILAETGGLLIRVKGEALMDGHHGQTVQVKNSRSGRKFSAEVVAPHTVRVKM